MVENQSIQETAAPQAPGNQLDRSITRRNLSFTASLPLYAISDKADVLDVRNQLDARLSQLNAMLTMIHGHGIDTFDSWSVPVKDNYLWACSMMAKECKDLTGLL